MGLNSNYNFVRSNILMMKPPLVAQANALHIQDEKQREVQSASIFTNESDSMNVKSGNFQSKTNYVNKNNVVRNQCKKPSHTVKKCYRLFKFPKDFKFTKGRNVAGNVTSYQQSSEDLLNQRTHSLSLPMISINIFSQ